MYILLPTGIVIAGLLALIWTTFQQRHVGSNRVISRAEQASVIGTTAGSFALITTTTVGYVDWRVVPVTAWWLGLIGLAVYSFEQQSTYQTARNRSDPNEGPLDEVLRDLPQGTSEIAPEPEQISRSALFREGDPC